MSIQNTEREKENPVFDHANTTITHRLTKIQQFHHSILVPY